MKVGRCILALVVGLSAAAAPAAAAPAAAAPAEGGPAGGEPVPLSLDQPNGGTVFYSDSARVFDARFTGTAQPGSPVVVTIGSPDASTLLCSGMPDADGAWSCVAPTMPDFVGVAVVRQGSSVVSRSVAAVNPPTLSPGLLSGITTDDPSFAVTGTAFPGSAIDVLLAGVADPACSAVAQADGTWQCALALASADASAELGGQQGFGPAELTVVQTPPYAGRPSAASPAVVFAYSPPLVTGIISVPPGGGVVPDAPASAGGPAVAGADAAAAAAAAVGTGAAGSGAAGSSPSPGALQTGTGTGTGARAGGGTSGSGQAGGFVGGEAAGSAAARAGAGGAGAPASASGEPAAGEASARAAPALRGATASGFAGGGAGSGGGGDGAQRSTADEGTGEGAVAGSGARGWDAPSAFGGALNLMGDPATFAPAHGASVLFFAAGILLFVALPAELLQSTIRENHTRIARRLGAGRRRLGTLLRPGNVAARAARRVAGVAGVAGRAVPQASRAAVAQAATLFAAALITAFGDPTLGFDERSVRVVVALAIVFVVVNCTAIAVNRALLTGEQRASATLALRPVALLLLVAGVALSRAAGIQPALVFGLILGLEISNDLRRAQQARVTVVVTAALMTLGVTAWIALSVFSPGWNAQPDVANQLATDVLAGITAESIAALVVALLPLAFLDGLPVFRWSRRAWAAVYLAALSVFALVILPMPSSWVDVPSLASPLALATAAFAAVSLAVWAYLRYTPAPVGVQSSVERCGAVDAQAAVDEHEPLDTR